MRRAYPTQLRSKKTVFLGKLIRAETSPAHTDRFDRAVGQPVVLVSAALPTSTAALHHFGSAFHLLVEFFTSDDFFIGRLLHV